VRAVNGIAKWLKENKSEFDKKVLLDFTKEIQEYNNCIKIWQGELRDLEHRLDGLIEVPTFIQYPTITEDDGGAGETEERDG
jgi:hypothetical protein